MVAAMYRTSTAPGMGQTSTPILSTAFPSNFQVGPGGNVAVGPQRVYVRGPHGRWWSAPRRRRPVVSVPATGVGCGCAGGGCNCNGMGQSVSNVPSDLWNTVQDLFLNADGSINVTAVALAGVTGFLVFANWGNTTRRKR